MGLHAFAPFAARTSSAFVIFLSRITRGAFQFGMIFEICEKSKKHPSSKNFFLKLDKKIHKS